MSSEDAHVVDRAFDATAPRRSQAVVVMLVLAGSLALAALLPGLRERAGSRLRGIEYVVPWLVLTLVLGAGWITAKRVRAARRLVSKALEHAQLEEWDALARVLNSAMSRPIRGLSERGNVLFMHGALLEHRGRYDLAARTYERMLMERIGDGYLLQNAQLCLAYCKVRAQELTDAVRMIERLEQVQMPDSLRARYEWIRLFQRVFMGHDRDALENLHDRIALFRRHLSTRAGFPYALVASALHRQGRRAEAAKYWADATTLIPADRLMNEYVVCRETGVSYPAVEHCL